MRVHGRPEQGSEYLIGRFGQVTVTRFYSAGIRRPAAGSVHVLTGNLETRRLEGRAGRVNALVLLDMRDEVQAALYEARVTDLLMRKWILSGLECTMEGAWVAQEWWVDVGP